MMLWLTLKNMLSRPLRTLVLLVCVTVASLAAYAAFDLGGAVTNIFKAFTSDFLGEMDCSVASTTALTEESFADCPPCNVVPIQFGSKREVKRSEQFYTYELTENVSVYGFPDMQKAYDMKVVQQLFDLGENEVAVGSYYSKHYGYDVGSTLTLADPDGEEFEVQVAAVFEEKGVLKTNSPVVVAPLSVTARMNGTEECNMAMVDIYDTPVNEFEEAVKDSIPGAEVSSFETGELENIVRSLNIVLYLLFTLTFLLVIFVTVSFTEKIIMERMSTIGTLRSLGMSRTHTTVLLMLENALYGLFGALVGTVLYSTLRAPVLDMATSFSDETSMTMQEMVGSTKPYVYAAVIGGAVLLELLAPLVYTLRAVRTPIRDIIFSTRDAEYTVSLPKTLVGAGLFAAGLVLTLATENPYLLIGAVLLLVIGAALSVQFVVKYAAKGLEALCRRLNAAGAEFACIEAGSKKSDMGNAVLTVTTITAAAAIFIIGSSMLYWTERPQYDTDVIIDNFDREKEKDLTYLTELELVSESQFVYETIDQIRVGGAEFYKDISVFPLPSGDQYIALTDLPETLSMNEVSMDYSLAKKLDLKEGDTFQAEYRSDGVFPIVREMTLVSYCNTLTETDGGGFVLHPDLYRELYGSYPRELLLRSNAGEDALYEKLDTILTGDEHITTMTEERIISEQASRETRLGLYAVIGVAMILTLIGISGNQIIGFDARRRELALLHSTAMSRGQLIGLLLLENAVSFGISIVTAAIVSIPVTVAIAGIFSEIDAGIVIIPRYGELAAFVGVILLIVMLTTLSPIRQILRMNTANEIKYE